MSFIQSIILGVVEGITEFLPVSSTAHLVLTSEFLGLSQGEFIKSFEIIIQLGAILAVAALYWKKLFQTEVLKRLAAAFIPTGILGLFFYGFIKKYLIGNLGVILWSLFLGGILMIVLEKFYIKKNVSDCEISEISLKGCLLIGLFQPISMIPGISRSAATITGGLFLGLGRKTIVEFSFFLAVPTMLAATGLDFINSAENFSLGEFKLLLAGFITSFIMAIFGMKFLLAYIQKHSFFAFGIYRIILVILFILFL